MKYYGLYKITNLVNGKMYIGQHATSDLDDGYMGSSKILKQAIRKYGPQCFRKEWICFCEDKQELDYMERVFVDQTWIDRSDTYNLKLGGAGGSAKGTNKGRPSWIKGKHLPESAKKALSEARKGKGNPMYGRRGESCPFYGKHHTEETKARCGDASRGRRFYNNGVINVRRYECPPGFVPGMAKSNRKVR